MISNKYNTLIDKASKKYAFDFINSKPHDNSTWVRVPNYIAYQQEDFHRPEEKKVDSEGKKLRDQ